MKKEFLFISLIFLGFLLSLGLVTAGLNEGLVSYYKLDRTSGPVVDELGIQEGVDNDGTARGANGIIGGAASFDGTGNQFIYFPENVAHRLGVGDFTVSFWVNVSEASYSYVLSKLQHNVQSDYIILLVDGKIVFEVWDGNSNGANCIGSHAVYSTNNISIGDWHHVVAKFDSSPQTISFYLDDVFQGSTSVGASNTCYNWPAAGGPKPLRLSGHHFSADYYNGAIDELGLWNRSLSAGEVADLYNGGAGLPFSVPVPTPPVLENATFHNVNVTNNLTVGNDVTVEGDVSATTGFFNFLGNSFLRITKGWFTEIDVVTLTASIISSNEIETDTITALDITADLLKLNPIDQTTVECNNETEGTISYNSVDRLFYGCIDKGEDGFKWKVMM